MKTLNRWIKNIKWLFNHPPTDTIQIYIPESCEFCGGRADHKIILPDNTIIITYCDQCFAKMFRKVVAGEKPHADI